MLRAGMTAPLIKFPRLIPVDPLIALSRQALQGDRGQRPGGTTNKHSTITMNEQNIQKEKKEAECENEKTDTLHGSGGGLNKQVCGQTSICVKQHTLTSHHPNMGCITSQAKNSR